MFRFVLVLLFLAFLPNSRVSTLSSFKYSPDPAYSNPTCPCYVRSTMTNIVVINPVSSSSSPSYYLSALTNGMMQAARDLDIDSNIRFIASTQQTLSYSQILQQWTTATAIYPPPSGILFMFQISDPTNSVNAYIVNQIQQQQAAKATANNFTGYIKFASVGNSLGLARSIGGVGLDMDTGCNNTDVGRQVANRLLSTPASASASASTSTSTSTAAGSALCVNANAGSSDADSRCQGFCQNMTACSTFSNFDLTLPASSNVVRLAGQLSSSYYAYIFVAQSDVAAVTVQAVKQVTQTALYSNQPPPRVVVVDASPIVVDFINSGAVEFAVDMQPYFTGYMSIALLALRIQTSVLPANFYTVTCPRFIDIHTAGSQTHAASEAAGFPQCDDSASSSAAARAQAQQWYPPGVAAQNVACFNRSDLQFVIADHLTIPSAFGASIKSAYRQAAIDMRVNIHEYVHAVFDGAVQAQDASLALGLISNSANSSSAFLTPPLPLGRLPDGLITSMASPSTILPILLNASALKVPVVGINSGYNDPSMSSVPLLAYVGQDEYGAGFSAGSLFASASPSSPVTHGGGALPLFAPTQFKLTGAVCLDHSSNNIAVTARCNGLRDSMKANNKTYLQFNMNYGNLQSNFDPVHGLMSSLMYNAYLGTSSGEVSTVVNIANTSSALPQYLGPSGNGLLLGSFDTSGVYPYIQSGAVLFGIDQQQYYQGYLPVLLLSLLHMTGGPEQGNRIIVGAAEQAAGLSYPFFKSGPNFVFQVDPVLLSCAGAAPNTLSVPANEYIDGTQFSLSSTSWPVCVKTAVPVVSSPLSVESGSLSSSASTALILLSCFGLVLCACSIVFVVQFRLTRVIHSSSSRLLVVCVLGVMLVFAAVIVNSLPSESVLLCTVHLFLFNLGATIALSALVFKTYRIYVIFSQSSLVKIQGMTDEGLLLAICAFVAVDVVLLICKTTIPSQMYVWDSVHSACYTPANIDITLVLLTVKHAVAILSAAIVSFLVRDMPSFYHEGAYLTLSVCAVLIFGVLALFVRYVAALDYYATTLIISENVFMLLSAFSVLCFIIAPKVYSVWKTEWKATAGATSMGFLSRRVLKQAAALRSSDRLSSSDRDRDGSGRSLPSPSSPGSPVAVRPSSPLSSASASDDKGTMVPLIDKLSREATMVRVEHERVTQKLKKASNDVETLTETLSKLYFRLTTIEYDMQYVKDTGVDQELVPNALSYKPTTVGGVEIDGLTGLSEIVTDAEHRDRHAQPRGRGTVTARAGVAAAGAAGGAGAAGAGGAADADLASGSKRDRDGDMTKSKGQQERERDLTKSKNKEKEQEMTKTGNRDADDRERERDRDRDAEKEVNVGPNHVADRDAYRRAADSVSIMPQLLNMNNQVHASPISSSIVNVNNVGALINTQTLSANINTNTNDGTGTAGSPPVHIHLDREEHRQRNHI